MNLGRKGLASLKGMKELLVANQLTLEIDSYQTSEVGLICRLPHRVPKMVSQRSLKAQNKYHFFTTDQSDNPQSNASRTTRVFSLTSASKSIDT